MLQGRSSTAAALAAAWLAAAAGSAAAQQVIVDNVDASWSVLSGSWSTGSFPTPWGADYRFAFSTGGAATAQCEWRPNLPVAGNYLVEIWYVQGANRATNAPFTVDHSGGSTPFAVNQQVSGSQWNTLGTFSFAAGAGGRVTLTNAANGSVVMADAVRFTFQEPVGTPPEFRGMWVSRFEWPNTSRTTVENNITAIMNNLQANGFNAVMFQVRGQCDTLYPSPEEPWSPLVSSNGLTPAGWGSFDPLQFAIDQAHARGIEFHAYINTHTAWQSGMNNPPTYNANHVYWDHLDQTNPNARDWLVHNESGTPVGFEESGYVWIAPGVPDAQAYVRRQVMYVVENYDIDGVHFDRIRTPGPEYSYDPISQARRLGSANPAGLGFADWTRDQITRMLRDVYAQINEVKPWVKISSSPLGLYTGSRYPGYPTSACGYLYGYSCVYQDAQAWLAAGAHDFIVPQIYWADGGGNPDFSEVLPDWIANDAGRHVYAGQTTANGVAALLSQIGVTRSQGAQGNVVFSYGSFNNNAYWDDYADGSGPYIEPAELPEMPWKDDPQHGIIIGNVVSNDGGDPLVDVRVTRNGSSYVALTSADGLYSHLLVPPGTYTLTFQQTGLCTRTIPNVEVVAGQVTRIDTSLGAPLAVGDFTGDCDITLADWPQMNFCFAGPGTSYSVGHFCLKGDYTGDLRVDLRDVAAFQSAVGD